MARSYGVMKILFGISVLFRIQHFTNGTGGIQDIDVMHIEADGDARIGRDLILTCIFPNVLQPERLVWFKDSDIIFANDDDIIWKSQRVEASTDDFKTTKRQHLVFKNVNWGDTGAYKCLVQGDDATEYESDLEVVISPDIVVAQLYQDIYLYCDENAVIRSPNILLWKKDSHIIAINRTIIRNSTEYVLDTSNLLILNVTSSSLGIYVCYNDGIKIHSYELSFDEEVLSSTLSTLKGWRGYMFGGAIGLLIVAMLAAAAYIQNKPFKGKL